jgi:hypothetical protein
LEHLFVSFRACLPQAGFGFCHGRQAFAPASAGRPPSLSRTASPRRIRSDFR